MSFTLTPEDTRNRRNIHYPVPESIKHILTTRAGPRLQMQFNDSNNKCIGESMVLKPENDDPKSTSFKTVCPNDDKRLIIPENAKSILIFGQQGIFASQDDLDYSYRKYDSDPEPTRGIVMSGPFFLSNRPYNFIISQFDLKTGQRNSTNYAKDIIRSIEFSNESFLRLNTIEPINVIR